MELLKKYGEYLALGGLACLAAAVVRFFVSGEFNVYAQALVVLGLVLLALYAAGRPRELARAVTGRQFRYGTNAAVMTVAFIGILVLLNYLGSRYEKRWDLTQDQSFSISEQTKKVLANLDKPIKVTGFFEQGDTRQQSVEVLLKEYRQYTGLLSWEFIDPDVQPAAARQAGVSAYPTLVFETQGRKQLSSGSDEQGITSAILKVSSADQKTIYFLTGHGERATEAAGQDGYSQARQLIEQDNYRVKTVTLAITATVPVDCAVLVIAAPTRPLLDGEVAAINTYLDKGGKLLFLTEPEASSGVEAGILKRFGVNVRADIVIDPASSLLGDIGSPLISNFEYSQITKDLKAAAIFPGTRSMVADTKLPEGVTVTPFANTSRDSWSESDLVNRQVAFDAAKDARGPVTVGMSVEAAPKMAGAETSAAARVVAFGDSDFASNAFLNTTMGNRDLFANAVNWLAEDERLISIRAKPASDRGLYMTSSEQTLGLLTSVVLLPLAVLLAGAVVWMRRR